MTSTKPAVTQLPVADAIAASYHGYTEQGWHRLTDRQRAKLRDSITHGERFNPAPDVPDDKSPTD